MPPRDSTAISRGSTSRIKSFPPIVSERSKLLILGSMRGEVSLKAGQYYAHPRNAFWHIMGELFGAGPSLLYEERIARIQSVGVALWDALQACTRPGSLDASITEEVANDFPGLFAKYPNITHVFFNGGTAEKSFRHHVLPALRADLQSGRLVRLDLPDWRGGTFTMHLHHAAGAPQGPAGRWLMQRFIDGAGRAGG
jgi:TDG/mug DNA glycosylase family protein